MSMEPSASPADGRSPSRRRLYFSLGTLLFLVLCFAGLFGGYRIGFNHGYAAGDAQRAAEKPVTRVYDVEDLVSTGPGGPKDFDSLVEVVTTTIEPNSWDDVGGPGSIKEFDSIGEQHSAVIIMQREDLHAQVEKLFSQIRAIRARGQKPQQ